MQQKNNISGHVGFPVRSDLLCSKDPGTEILKPKGLFKINKNLRDCLCKIYLEKCLAVRLGLQTISTQQCGNGLLSWVSPEVSLSGILLRTSDKVVYKLYPTSPAAWILHGSKFGFGFGFFFLVSVLAHAVEGDACFIDAFFNSSLIRVTPFWLY